MSARLRTVPEVSERALELVRVSKEREGMVAPEVQRVAIGDYCTTRGYLITERLEGLDESGSRSRSAWWAKLEQAVEMVEHGLIDVIVVWKFSRVARHRLKWAVAIDRVEAVGGRIESATEQLDTGTSTGRLARGMLGELNAFQAEIIGESWKEAHAQRIRAGKPANGKPRWGYVYDRELKLHVPDPDLKGVVVECYQRYVAGESVYQLVRWLNGHGHRTIQGGQWSDRSLRRVLDSGFAAGFFMAGGDVTRKVAPTRRPGVHEALIDADLWQAYLDARGIRRARPARAERSQYLLSGLVRCARCGGTMVAGQFGEDRRSPKYRCKRAKESGPTACRGGYVMARFVEGTVVAWLQDLAAQVDDATSTAAAAVARRTTVRSEADRLSRELVRAEEALTRLAVQNASTPLPPAVYEAAARELTVQTERLRAALEVSERAARRAVRDPGAVARGLLAGWATTPVEHRREVLRDLLGAVLVFTGRPRARIVPVEAWECRG